MEVKAISQILDAKKRVQALATELREALQSVQAQIMALRARFGGEGQDALWLPCPDCGEQFGHVVEQGRELFLNRLEAS